MSAVRFASFLRPLTVLFCLGALGAFLAACGSDPADTGEIEVAITSPDEGTFHNEATLVVQGTAQGTETVNVNGESANVEDGQWSAVLTFEEDGEVTITASAGDRIDSVDVVIDTFFPDIVIESPERGTVIDSEADGASDTITVRGHLVDAGPSGLAYMEVDGRPVELDDDGNFEAELSLEVGLNIFTLEAMDRALNERVIRQGIIYGPLADPQSPINEAARLDVTNPDGVNAIAEVIEAYLTPEQVNEFVIDGFDEEDIPVEITNVTWEELNLDLDTVDGAIEVAVHITDFRIDGQFQLDEESDILEGFVEIAEITIHMDVVLSADEDNQLAVDIPNSQVELDEEDVTIDLAGESPDWLRSAVTAVILYGFEEFVGVLVEDNLYDPSLLTQELEFLNRTMEITFLLEDVVISPNGISAYLGLEFPAESHPDVADVAGALHRPVSGAAGGSIFKPLSFHSNRTTFDRILHTVWRSGLFHQSVGQEDLAETALPFELTADGLGGLLDPRIRDIHETTTPAEIRLRPLLAPVIEFRSEGKDHDATARIGDFLIDFLLRPDANTETRFLTVALHLDVDVTLVIEDNNIDFEIDVTAMGDVADEPEFSFNHDDVLGLITNLIELVPAFLADDLSIETEAALEWARLSNPVVEIHGEDRDRISAGLELEPVPEFIEDDDVVGDDD